MRVEYRYIRPTQVFYARVCGPYEIAAPAAWRRVSNWLDRKNARRLVQHVYGCCRDDPKLTAPELLRYDACVPVAVGLAVDDEQDIFRQTLPGGAYAVCTHVGSYAEAGSRFSDLRREIVPRHGLTIDLGRPFLAIYLNDPAVTREAYRRTELCVPVVPVAMLHAGNDDLEQSVVFVRAQSASGP